jgi:uncharacterized protein YegJ (DUF2314 family)
MKHNSEEKQVESLFIAISATDQLYQAAHAQAAKTMSEFRDNVQRNGDHVCSAKLRFRDPTESERTGRDAFLFIWLTEVVFDSTSGFYTGTFFEVPAELKAWHSSGQKLAFEPEDVFDWMVNDNGSLIGGFTLRVHRNSLPESERSAYDLYVGVKQWV